MSAEKGKLSKLDIALQGIGFLSCIMIIRGLTMWRSCSPESQAVCLVAIYPAYLFIRNARRLNLESLQYILLWVGVVALFRGFQYISLGYVPLTGKPVSDSILSRCFGLALITFCCGGICFWIRSSQKK